MANSSGPESHKLRQRSSTSPSVLPLMRRSAPGARSSEREGRRPGYCCCSIEDDGNHNARPRLSCVGPATVREASGGQGGGACDEGGGAARLTHGSDGEERQWI